MRPLLPAPVLIVLFFLLGAGPVQAQSEAGRTGPPPDNRLELPAPAEPVAAALTLGSDGAGARLASALRQEDGGGTPAWVWGAVIGGAAGAGFAGLVLLALRDAGLGAQDDEDVIVPLVLWTSGGAVVGGVIAALIWD